MKAFLRNAQTFFPWIRPLKFGSYNFLTRHFGARIEPEFLCLKVLAPGGVAIDVGGNWGQSIHALKRIMRPERVVSFEPNPVLARRLAKAFANDSSVEVHEAALSTEPGSLRLHVPSYRNYIYDGLASLDRDEAAGWLRPSRVYPFDAAKVRVDSFDVAVNRLDDYGLSPEVVKIDVQGHELSVLRGGIETFRRSRPITILEDATPEVVAFFADLDMQPYTYVDGALVPGRLPARNTMFMSDDGARRLGAA